MSANSRRISSPSRSPRPGSLTSQISSIGAKINGAFSGGRDSDSINSASTVVAEGANARSISRGRQGFSSSGRGGLGNIHENGAGYEEPIVRGRERIKVATIPQPAFSTGRGGLGNMRAPSVEPVTSDAASSKSAPTLPTSVTVLAMPGKYSRSLSRGSPVVSTGRGGAGNIRNPPSGTSPHRRTP
ncbi:hypothetical protein E1B28_005560 [Marasmius oreades]|uniref:Uncharacterized protein n=1 Tax=Marasmius oreades TaxID=181124 RepID=A0A9P7UUQ0_9AGAR|nr:uncharacterized protein E1B28_005560 [Marasmius oreades]KAG7094743.1 hypothetical protein E1B28_005560 [Marasmius oreades]